MQTEHRPVISTPGVIPTMAVTPEAIAYPANPLTTDQQALLIQLKSYLGSAPTSETSNASESTLQLPRANPNDTSPSASSLSSSPSFYSSRATTPGATTPNTIYTTPPTNLSTLRDVLTSMAEAPIRPPLQTNLISDLSEISDEPADAMIEPVNSPPPYPFNMPANRIERAFSLKQTRGRLSPENSMKSGESSGASTPMSEESPALRPRSRSLPVLPQLASCPIAKPDGAIGNALKSRTAHINRKAQKLIGGLSEIIESELAYVEDLAILKEVYFDVLDTTLNATTDEKDTIKRNLDALLELHRRISASLTAVNGLSQWRSQPSLLRLLAFAKDVADIFTSYASELAIYGEFCSKHSDAMAILRSCQEDRQGWDLYMVLCTSRMAAHHKAQSALRQLPQNPPLHLYDYAIKPVQRICRYPMLFETLARTLNDRVPEEREAADAVKTALKAITKSAAGVDRARQKMLAERRTGLVASRVELPQATQPAFLGILGQVNLVGALYFTDLHPLDQQIKVRYYGCFLYATHLVLVKARTSQSYEPRHWFPLRIFEIESLPDDEGTLPFSLRLTYGRQQFELSAVSRQERDVWFERISDAIDLRRQYWRKSMLQAASDASYDDTVVSSITVFPGSEDYFAPVPPTDFVQAHNLKPTARAKMSQRASNLIGRSSATSRAAVDLRMADIFSDECLMARAQQSEYAEVDKAISQTQRSKSTDARIATGSMSLSGTFSRKGTLRDAARRKSAIFDRSKSTASSFHRRRSSADVVSFKDNLSSESAPVAQSEPNSPVLQQGELANADTDFSHNRNYKKGGWLQSRLSFVHKPAPTPHDTPLLGTTDADVMRNGSSSSSGSSHGLMVQTPSPGSSAPPSPLITPNDHGLWDVFHTIGRKSSMASLRKRSPSLGSAEQDALAASASDFLYGINAPAKQSRPSLVSWVSMSKSKRSAMDSSRRTLSLTSLAAVAPPALSTNTSPALSSEASMTARREDLPPMTRSDSNTSGETVSKSRNKLTRQRSLKMFKNLTRMTSMTAN